MKDSPSVDHCPHHRAFSISFLCSSVWVYKGNSPYSECLYNFPFFGVNSESDGKLRSFSTKYLAQGFKEEFWWLLCPSFPSDAFIFTELRGKKVYFTAKVLASVGDGWTMDIWKEVKRLCMDRNMCYSGGHQCLAVGSSRRYDMNIVFGSYNWGQRIQGRGI
jgi:hypothetical protein